MRYTEGPRQPGGSPTEAAEWWWTPPEAHDVALAAPGGAAPGRAGSVLGTVRAWVDLMVLLTPTVLVRVRAWAAHRAPGGVRPLLLRAPVPTAKKHVKDTKTS